MLATWGYVKDLQSLAIRSASSPAVRLHSSCVKLAKEVFHIQFILYKETVISMALWMARLYWRMVLNGETSDCNSGQAFSNQRRCMNHHVPAATRMTAISHYGREALRLEYCCCISI